MSVSLAGTTENDLMRESMVALRVLDHEGNREILNFEIEVRGSSESSSFSSDSARTLISDIWFLNFMTV